MQAKTKKPASKNNGDVSEEVVQNIKGLLEDLLVASKLAQKLSKLKPKA